MTVCATMTQKRVVKLCSLNNYFKDEMKLIEKGENAIESGHVMNMIFDDNLKIIKGAVQASMKDKIYKVEIFLDKDFNVCTTTCTCPRGQLSCHHVAALGLFAHYNISVTDRACSWSAPSSTKLTEQTVKTIDDMFPVTREYRATNRTVTKQEVDRLQEELASFGGAVGYSWLLAPKLLPKEDMITNTVSDIIFSSDYNHSSNRIKYFEEKMYVSPEKVISIFDKTVGQSKNPLWLVMKKLRLTASLFGLVLAACKRNSFPPSLYKKLTGSYNLDGVKAVQWGRQHEETAVTAFISSTGLAFVPAGLWLHPCGYLGASPDGLVGEDALLEIKCPFKYRNCRNLREALSNEKKYICSFDVQTNNFVLNAEHEYYAQIQGQLHILNKSTCYLVIWTPKDCLILSILKQEEWSHNIEILKNFYINKFLLNVINNTDN